MLSFDRLDQLRAVRDRVRLAMPRALGHARDQRDTLFARYPTVPEQLLRARVLLDRTWHLREPRFAPVLDSGLSASIPLQLYALRRRAVRLGRAQQRVIDAAMHALRIAAGDALARHPEVRALCVTERLSDYNDEGLPWGFCVAGAIVADEIVYEPRPSTILPRWSAFSRSLPTATRRST
jgi:hypothetical protein